MIKMQKTFLTYEEQLQKELNVIPELAEHVAGFEELSPDNLGQAMREQTLLIPVVGAFSAGKTSLINSFMGQKNKLPVDLTPETSLATEIFYSGREYVEAVKADGSVDEYKIEELGTVKSRAKQYQFMRVYCSSEQIRDIEPLVLVDMPGFNSPLDLHNKAIVEYINRGCHYVVLLSVEEGTIHRPILRQLHDIDALDRRFSFVLSKVNLRSSEEANKISDLITTILHDEFDYSPQIVQVDKNGSENLHKILTSIDPEQLFKELYIPSLQQQYEKILSAINTSLVARRREKEDNDTTVAELKRGLEKIGEQKDRALEDIRDQHKGMTDNIIQAVGRALTESTEELILLMGANDTNDTRKIEQRIAEIVRSTIVSKTKGQMEGVIDDVLGNFAEQLSSLNLNMQDFSMKGTSWSDGLMDRVRSSSSSMGHLLSGLESMSKSSGKSRTLYKSIAVILGITTKIVAPIIEIFFIFLPDILDFIGKPMREQKQKAQLRSNIQQKIIPDIKSKLRTELPELIDQQLQDITRQIGKSFEEELEKQVMLVEKAEEKRKSENPEETIKVYEDVQQAITTLANTNIYE